MISSFLKVNTLPYFRDDVGDRNERINYICIINDNVIEFFMEVESSKKGCYWFYKYCYSTNTVLLNKGKFMGNKFWLWLSLVVYL